MLKGNYLRNHVRLYCQHDFTVQAQLPDFRLHGEEAGMASAEPAVGCNAAADPGGEYGGGSVPCGY